MKKIRLKKKTKKKLLNILDTIFTMTLNLVIFLSIITREYGLGIILMLGQIYVYLLNFKVNLIVEVPSDVDTKVKKVVTRKKKDKR